MSICQTVSVYESKPWNAETFSYDETAPTTYRVSCPAHGNIYKGTDSELALPCRDSHRNCVTPLSDHFAFAFSTVATRTEVFATFMSADELRKTHNGRKSRVFVDYSDVPLGPEPEASVKGENADLDAQWRAYNKAEMSSMRLVVSRVRSVMEMFFGQPEGAKLSFSRKAGCGTCPCSPGFIMTGQVKAERQSRYYDRRIVQVPVDVHVGPVFGNR